MARPTAGNDRPASAAPGKGIPGVALRPRSRPTGAGRPDGHGLRLAAEALFDSGNHVLAGEFQEAADEYRDVPRRLAARRVISTATSDRLESLAGFRTVLVREYAAVDVRRVHAGLDRRDDFEAFVTDVEDWPGRSGR